MQKQRFATFEDWLDETDLPAAAKFRDELLKFCLSSELFQEDLEKAELLLHKSGIPLIAACEIVRSAARYFAKQHELRSAPLAVFWDVENVAVPKETTGSECHAAISRTLSCFGNLDQLNIYVDAALNVIPSEKRSQLQLSGCHIIDTPHMHNSRKEVADKMIIVDALCYAMTKQSTGATLCFITNDQDFAYLLSRIARMPKFRTVLIMSNPSANSILAQSADHVLLWNVDLFKQAPAIDLKLDPDPIAFQPPVFAQAVANHPEVGHDEEEADSEQLLISVMTRLNQAGYDSPARSLVASGLRDINPVRFGTQASRKRAIDAGINAGILILSGVEGRGNLQLARPL